jgi:hypothetical protein
VRCVDGHYAIYWAAIRLVPVFAALALYVRVWEARNLPWNLEMYVCGCNVAKCLHAL